ncbi:Homeodomain-like protein [Dactylonectria estremocensis]|uniref:Homeodomain-like protein n=1 Tax=Dactylonectria estremocensis TaxID=1079267 RepID=A0A9P9DFJ2_9HYPO|nr:Homeodomain-like protein [Dactylonectria estremocensis]
MTAHRRGPWANAEDFYLMQLVQTHGPLNWVRIAHTMGSRTPKQCRERYHQNLKPTLNHDHITLEEGIQIERLVHEIGKRWAEIARRLHGRSDNAVKNWWNGSQNRRKRLDRRRAVQAYDGHCSRTALSISTPTLPLPRTQSSTQSTPGHRHPMPWVEAPLPSPCSSESAESDSGSNYTTSPGRHSISLHMPVELPPLRTAAVPWSGGPKLPSLSSLASPSFGDMRESQPRLPPLVPQNQLPTAPNSPVQQQPQLRQQPQVLSDKDSRMNVAALLG